MNHAALVEVLEARRGEQDLAVLYDPVTRWTFGPAFCDTREAEGFLLALGQDPRLMGDDDLQEAVESFRARGKVTTFGAVGMVVEE